MTTQTKALNWNIQGAKQDKQLEAEERARMLKRESMMREIELGALNTKRYRTLWREMMMRIKMPQIVENVQIAWRNFDRALDIKDYRMSFLMDALAEAEEQYQKNARSQAEIIDRLLRTYSDRMQHEKNNYQKVLSKTLDQTDAEINKLNCRQNEDEITLQSIIRDAQRQREESLNNTESITMSKIDEFVEDNKNVRRISVTLMENQLRNCWEVLRQVLADYENSTKNRRKCYETVKEKDESDQQVIAQQLRRTASLFDEIRKLRSKITMYNATAKRDISEFLVEHDFFHKSYWTVKNRFLSEQIKDKNQLKILTIEYNRTVKHLERLVTKGKRLLMLMQICRKYETQDEKIIPFIDRTEIENFMPSSHRTSVLPNWDTFCQIAENFDDLTNFWRRLGAVQIITAQLRSQRDLLKTESNHLRECVNFYMMQKARVQ